MLAAMTFAIEFFDDESAESTKLGVVTDDNFGGFPHATDDGIEVIIVKPNSLHEADAMGHIYSTPATPNADESALTFEVDLSKCEQFLNIPAGWRYEQHVRTLAGHWGRLVIQHVIDQDDPLYAQPPYAAN
jgi:hypothetical protein